MRQGPGCRIGSVAEAVGVPSATARAWLKRHGGLRFAWEVVKAGPSYLVNLYAERGLPPDRPLLDALEDWPVHRGLLLWGGAAKAMVSDRGAQMLDHEELCRTFGTGIPFKALTAEHFLDEGDEAEVFRLAERHHHCEPPCNAPHTGR